MGENHVFYYFVTLPFLKKYLLSSLQVGHILKDCLNAGTKTCYKCGGIGHILKDCPNRGWKGDDDCDDDGDDDDDCDDVDYQFAQAGIEKVKNGKVKWKSSYS